MTLARSPYSVALSAAALLMLWGPAVASSIPGHYYSATRILDRNPRLAAFVGTHRAAYLAGSAGPDIAFVASDPNDRTSAGAESHYDRTGDLCLGFLKEARTDAERAFALGWVTHWLTDQAIHSLVNAYGGNWEEPAQRSRHSQLEVVEVKHVYSLREEVPGLGGMVLASTDVPVSLMRRAFRATYDKPAFAEGSDFESRLTAAAGFIGLSTAFYKEACESGTGQGQGGLINLALETYSSKVPSTKQYEALLEPLEITDTTVDEDGLHVTVHVHDVGLYAKFLTEWQVAMDSVVDYSPTLFEPLVDLLEDPTAANEARASEVLWSVDLDNPARNAAALARVQAAMPALFALMDDGTLRGKPAVDDLLLAAKVGDTAARLLDRIDISALPTTGFDKSREGEIECVIPIPADVMDEGGEYQLLMGIGDREELTREDLEGVMWLHHEGNLEPEEEKPGGCWVLSDRQILKLNATNNPTETFEAGADSTSAWARTTIRPLDGPVVVVESTHSWTELPAFLDPGRPVRIAVSAEGTGGTLITEMDVNRIRRVRSAILRADAKTGQDGSSTPGKAEVEYEPINPLLDGRFNRRGITPPLTGDEPDPKLEMAIVVDCSNERGASVRVTHIYKWRP